MGANFADFFSMTVHHRDEVGAHVSASGGVLYAPARAHELDAVVLQLFTKQPSRWAEPHIDDETADAFRAECDRYDVSVAGVEPLSSSNSCPSNFARG